MLLQLQQLQQVRLFLLFQELIMLRQHQRLQSHHLLHHDKLFQIKFLYLVPLPLQ